MVYNKSLSDSEVAAVHNYLANKWQFCSLTADENGKIIGWGAYKFSDSGSVIIANRANKKIYLPYQASTANINSSYGIVCNNGYSSSNPKYQCFNIR